MASDKQRRGFSRRRFIQGAAAAAAASGSMLSSAAREEEDADEKRGRRPPNDAPDTVLINGKIHTMDDENTVVSSVSITDGRFAEVGHASRGRHGPNTKVIDLRGRTVVPGIIDNHNHIVLMGNRPGYHTPLENAYSIDDVKAIYAARAAGIPRDAWITTIGGFHSNHIYANPADPLSGRLPTRQELDAAVPNNPVFIEIGFTGPATTNSAGKSIFEGQGITVAENGSMTGNNPSRALLYLRQTLLNPESRRRSVIDAMNYAVTVGVTTHLDQGAFQATNTAADGAAHEDNFTMHIPFLQVYAQDKAIIRLRINFLHMDTTSDTPELVQRLKNAFPFLGNDMVKTGAIGEFIATYPPATNFVAAAKRVAAANWRAEVHSLGRRNTPMSNAADFETEILAFEEVEADRALKGVIRDRRWVIAHVPGITQEWIDRLQAIGGNLSLTGWQYLRGGLPSSTVAPYAGPPFRMIVDSGKRSGGIRAGMSSDGRQIAPMNRWTHMYYATTGFNARGESINPGQQITRQEVLSLYTRQNGWFLREEDQLGTIESGKLADLVVLNSDYFAVPDEDLKKIRSVLTVVGGNVVYDGGVLDLRD